MGESSASKGQSMTTAFELDIPRGIRNLGLVERIAAKLGPRLCGSSSSEAAKRFRAKAMTRRVWEGSEHV